MAWKRSRILGSLGLAWVLAGCGEVGPGEYREQVFSGEGRTMEWAGIVLEIPSWGAERAFFLFPPPSLPPLPAGTVRAAVGIGPAEARFDPPALLTLPVQPALASTDGLHLWRLDTTQRVYEEVPSPEFSLEQGGSKVRCKVAQGGVFVLGQE